MSIIILNLLIVVKATLFSNYPIHEANLQSSSVLQRCALRVDILKLILINERICFLLVFNQLCD